MTYTQGFTASEVRLAGCCASLFELHVSERQTVVETPNEKATSTMQCAMRRTVDVPT
jgi:hypothetical protein